MSCRPRTVQPDIDLQVSIRELQLSGWLRDWASEKLVGQYLLEGNLFLLMCMCWDEGITFGNTFKC